MVAFERRTKINHTKRIGPFDSAATSHPEQVAACRHASKDDVAASLRVTILLEAVISKRPHHRNAIVE